MWFPRKALERANRFLDDHGKTGVVLMMAFICLVVSLVPFAVGFVLIAIFEELPERWVLHVNVTAHEGIVFLILIGALAIQSAIWIV